MRGKYLAVMLVFVGCQRSPSPAAPVDVIELSLDGGPEEATASPHAVEGKDTAAPAEEKPELSWTALSADGRAEVRQTRSLGGKGCTASSTVSTPFERTEVMWKWDTCVATREQLKFVSPDGQRVIVLDALPGLVGQEWRGLELVTLYEQGLRLKFLRAQTAVRTPEVRREPFSGLAWVKGTAGLPGTPPKYTDDGGAIEFETVDGQMFRLGFDGAGFPPPAEEARVFMAEEGMYRYTDEQGTVRVVNSVDDIPERYRSRAARVRGEVTVRPAPKPQAPPPSAKEEPAKEALPPELAKELPGVPPQLVPPSKLINEAKETVEKVQEIRREQDRVLETLH
ncbi:hypothetical protein [Cystobacter ferrugineus]|uniref:Lipoprotein n=1 Tax=Cystobacter ferrugineus TaxID=83449 RepID=A0A1L9BKI1_9BACT|nr:hypothetical protein [Cystobacter ferrugineus]OJH42757.1 hypothetical protein BON30_06155 [Cystobacter ferrugineus]